MIRHTGGNSNIKTLQDKWELQNNNPIELFCDNKAAITFSGNKMIYSLLQEKSLSLLMEICALLSKEI
jgi:hypothetical protein